MIFFFSSPSFSHSVLILRIHEYQHGMLKYFPLMWLHSPSCSSKQEGRFWDGIPVGVFFTSAVFICCRSADVAHQTDQPNTDVVFRLSINTSLMSFLHSWTFMGKRLWLISLAPIVPSYLLLTIEPDPLRAQCSPKSVQIKSLGSTNHWLKWCQLNINLHLLHKPLSFSGEPVVNLGDVAEMFGWGTVCAKVSLS